MKRNAIYPFRPPASKRISPPSYSVAVAVSQFTSLRVWPVFLAPRIDPDVSLRQLIGKLNYSKKAEGLRVTKAREKL